MARSWENRPPKNFGQFVSHAIWSGSLDIIALNALSKKGLITVCELAHLTKLVEILDAAGGVKDSGAIFEATKTWPLEHVYAARRAMWMLFRGDPILRAFDIAIAARIATPAKPYPLRARKFSTFFEELPADFQDALNAMANGCPGVHGEAPVPSMVQTTRTKICEFAKAARDTGLKISLTTEAAIAYEKSLVQRERPLSKRTVLSSMRQIHGFAKYVGATSEVLSHLAERIRIHEKRSLHVVPQKEAKIQSLPSYAEIFGIALDMLGRADQVRFPAQAQAMRNAAVAITLFCPFPFRVADTRLHFGRDILWDGELYRFNTVISKTMRPFAAPILPVFGFFIDQMILQGARVEHLNGMRESCFDRQRALFVRYEDSNVHPRYVSHLWQTYLGTGEHAARTHLHNNFGRLGARGVELAMRACDHRSEKTAEHYRTQAFELLSLERIHNDVVADILDEEWQIFFGR